MKKITFFVCDIYQMGGIEKVVTLIANKLSEKYEVEIISLYKDAEEPFYKLNSKVKVWNILGKQLEPIKVYYPYLWQKVKKTLKNYKTDTFICAGMGYVGLSIFMKQSAKYIAWEHSSCTIGKVGGVMWLGRKLAAKYADKIVVLTKKDMENNINKFNTEDKICQIYNPIDNVFYNNKEYNIATKKIVSCGRLAYEKGFDMLVDVAKKVFEKHPDWQWHIYGDGPEKDNLEILINNNGLEKSLKLMGRTNKMLELYNEYAMYVLTSRNEGLGLVNIEAHYAKLPIVAFNCDCGPGEIVQDGINGYLVDCFDIEKMSEKINYLIENEDVRLNMSNKTMLDKEKLQMKNVIEKWEEII